MKNLKFGYGIFFGHANIMDGIRRASFLGFDCVDIALDNPSMLQEDSAEISKALRAHNLSAGVQAPWEAMHLASPWSQNTKAMLEIIDQCAEFAINIGAEYFNVHLREDLGFFSKNFADRLIQNMTKSLSEIMSRNSEKLMITIETPGFNFFSRLDNYLRILEHTNASVCLDLGHVMQTCHSENRPFQDWLEALKDRIKVVHLSGCQKQHGFLSAHFEPIETEMQHFWQTLEFSPNLEFIVLEIFKGFKDETQREEKLISILESLKANV